MNQVSRRQLNNLASMIFVIEHMEKAIQSMINRQEPILPETAKIVVFPEGPRIMLHVHVEQNSVCSCSRCAAGQDCNFAFTMMALSVSIMGRVSARTLKAFNGLHLSGRRPNPGNSHQRRNAARIRQKAFQDIPF